MMGQPAHRVLCVGQATLDHIVDIAALRPGHKHVASSRVSVGGGVAANAAVTVSRLGGRAVFLGCLGADHAGDQVESELINEGVDVSLVVRRAGAVTPMSCVIVDAAGDRTIVNHTPVELFDDDGPDMSALRPDAVLVDGRWPAAADKALRLARAIGVPSVVDVDRAPVDGDLGVLGLASHLVFSADALAALTGADDPATGLTNVAASTDAVVAVTLGRRGVGWLDGDRFQSLPAFAVAVVDTTGAGDVFHGAFALALAERMDLSQAFRFASAAAALKCSRPGGRLGAPDRRSVDDLLGVGATS